MRRSDVRVSVLAPIYQFLACRRGRHRDAQVMADELIGSDLGDAYPEAAICEGCGRAVDWPNGTPGCKAEGRSSPSYRVSAARGGLSGTRRDR